MKRIISFAFLMGLILSCPSFVAAQLKVFDNGNVGIQTGTTTPLSSLVVGSGAGDASSKVSIYGNNGGLFVGSWGLPTGTWVNGIYSKMTQPVDRCVGVRGEVSFSVDRSNIAFGVLGVGLNGSRYGLNYGVAGMILPFNSGAGVLGIANVNYNLEISGVYAGYFVGDVKATGLINGITVGNSDMRYKRNIKGLADNKHNTLQDVLSLNPVEYNLNQVYLDSKVNKEEKIAIYDENSQIFQKKHYGLIAQDLQKLYPDLVYEDENGYLSINYTGLIPLLIQSIKDLNEKIDAQATTSSASPAAFANSEIVASLGQNAPNPFTSETRIKYHLPQTVSVAYLCIYDMNGRQLKQIAIPERGSGSVTISGSEFTPGIYLYGLITDGKEVDIKRMVLTE